MKGWIIDCYPDTATDSMVTWLRTNAGTERIVDPKFRPAFYVWAPRDKMDDLKTALRTVGMDRYTEERRRTWLAEKERTVLRIVPSTYDALMPMARSIDRWGLYRDYRLFNVDFRMDHRYFMAHDIFPMGLLQYDGQFQHMDTPYRLDYPLPELRTCHLDVKVRAAHHIPTLEDPLETIKLDDIIIEGEESSMLEQLDREVRHLDPDVIVSDGGDGFYLDHLSHRAGLHDIRLELGREEGMRQAKGKSYFTYGRIVYKAPAHKLRGRVHIDSAGSFMYDESGLSGIIDLSRLSRIPLQEMSRLSPGTAISAMQVNEALRMGTLVLWKKNLPEDFKTAGELLISDRGGFIYEPKVGIHDHVTEVDFASLYPSIMVVHNISPETIKCQCCPGSHTIVPGLGYRTCERREGLLPRVLRPIIKRRLALKRLAKEGGRRAETYGKIAKALKWVLVTCFGYTGYRNARFGRIECHEAINAYGREIMLQTAEMAEGRGFRILHGIVDSLWLEGDGDARAFCSDVSRRVGIPLQLDGVYRWIVFLPNVSTGVGALNRYYGLFESGEMKLRGIALRKGDTPQLVREMQKDMLDQMARCPDSTEYREAIPEFLNVPRRYVEELRAGSVPLQKLVITKRVSREIEEYAPRRNESLEALKELKTAGFRVPPGEMVEYVVLAQEKRVRPAQFIQGDERYDPAKYADMVRRACSELLAPFGYDMEKMRSILP
jgi:DNA polymerase elongation subunit (family B)